MVDSFETIKLTQLVAKINVARNNKQYCFIWDKQGNVPVFFNYQAKLFDFGPEIVKKAMGKITDEELWEALRVNFAYSWRAGWNQGIFIGENKVNFKSFGEPCPCDKFFSWEISHDDDNAKTVDTYTRGDEERTSLEGHKQNFMMMHDDYAMSIITQCKEEADVLEILSNCPHGDKMKCYIVE